MKILVLKEKRQGENRVALTPDLITKYNKIGYEVLIEEKAGEKSFISDAQYQEAGAKIINDATKEIPNADIIIKVQDPLDEEIKQLAKAKKGAVIVAMLNPYNAENI